MEGSLWHSSIWKGHPLRLPLPSWSSASSIGGVVHSLTALKAAWNSATNIAPSILGRVVEPAVCWNALSHDCIASSVASVVAVHPWANDWWGCCTNCWLSTEVCVIWSWIRPSLTVACWRWDLLRRRMRYSISPASVALGHIEQVGGFLCHAEVVTISFNICTDFTSLGWLLNDDECRSSLDVLIFKLIGARKVHKPQRHCYCAGRYPLSHRSRTIQKVVSLFGSSPDRVPWLQLSFFDWLHVHEPSVPYPSSSWSNLLLLMPVLYPAHFVQAIPHISVLPPSGTSIGSRGFLGISSLSLVLWDPSSQLDWYCIGQLDWLLWRRERRS